MDVTSAAVEPRSPRPWRPTDDEILDRAPRAAAGTFAAVAAAAAVLYLWAGRDEWFSLDEWDFLADRTAGDLGSILRPHNEHWTTLPILAYRALFNVFGLRTYVPYLVLAIAVHLAVATLLRAIMRRSGVRPWLATAAASSFVLFGAGDANILRGFQITFTGAIAFGLLQILLADHPGPIDRRDALGVAAGVAALACSGVGISMVVAAGIAAFVARGWRAAAVHSVPLAVVYLLWWQLEGRPSTDAPTPPLRRQADFVRAAFDETLDGMTKSSVLRVVLLVVVLVGLALLCRHLGRPAVRRAMAAPLGLAVAAVIFISVVASSRAFFGPGFARAPRYVYVLAALLLPALALAADAISRRWRWTSVPLVLLFLFPIPANVAVALDDDSAAHQPRGDRELVLALAARAASGGVDEGTRPDPTGAREVTAGWLARQVRAGRIPASGPIDPALDAEVTLRLSVQQVDQPAPFVGCEPLRGPVVRELQAGDRIGIRGGTLRLTNVVDGRPLGQSMTVQPSEGGTLVAVDGPITIRILRDDDRLPGQVCD